MTLNVFDLFSYIFHNLVNIQELIPFSSGKYTKIKIIKNKTTIELREMALYNKKEYGETE